MAKRSLALRNGSKVTVSGKLFKPAGAPDIELLAHRVILSIVDGAAGLGTGFVVSEPVTGGLIVSRALTSQTLAISAAEEIMARPGAADHVRHKIGLQRSPFRTWSEWNDVQTKLLQKRNAAQRVIDNAWRADDQARELARGQRSLDRALGEIESHSKLYVPSVSTGNICAR